MQYFPSIIPVSPNTVNQIQNLYKVLYGQGNPLVIGKSSLLALYINSIYQAKGATLLSE